MKCQRCGGFTQYERDEDGDCFHCINCGWRQWIDPKPVLDIPGRQSLEVKENRRGPRQLGMKL